ncbi:MAG: hypothetical protein J5I91_08250 [Bacteroidetes bacterium]|nr:hypothetical protein [Bacteroidota bacterium]
MLKKTFSYFIFSILLCISAGLKAKGIYTNVPVLLVVSSENQPDTMGFNLAGQLPEIIYALVLQEKITLWDSPKKTIKISADALQSIENSTNTEFTKSKYIFINELWTSSRNKFAFDIIGLSFMNESPKGRVSYGYIDMEEAAPFLFKEHIKSNANGPAFVSYMAALYSRRYIFSVVQFGTENFEKNIDLEAKIHAQAVNPDKKQETQIFLKPIKEVTYSIDKKPIDKYGIGMQLFDGFEKLLFENLEVFFELGADKYFDFKKYRSEFAVTRIEVDEVWEKYGDYITMIPRSITIYVNNKKLNPISIEYLRILKFNIGLKSIEDILLEKQFDFQLVKINKSYINPEDATLYYQAMKEYSWTQLTRFVKYSKTN